MRQIGARCVALVACLFVLACSDSPSMDPTGSICPPASTLTYENFGKPFMEKYCTRCHSSELLGSQRKGAPLYHDFDSLLGVVVVADHVDEYTAAGPDSVNKIMPPDGVKPILAERMQLGEWLACELIRVNEQPDGGPAPDAGAQADAMPTADLRETP